MKFIGIFILLSIFAYSQVMADDKQNKGKIPIKGNVFVDIDATAVAGAVLDTLISYEATQKLIILFDKALKKLAKL